MASLLDWWMRFGMPPHSKRGRAYPPLVPGRWNTSKGLIESLHLIDGRQELGIGELRLKSSSELEQNALLELPIVAALRSFET